MAEKVCPVVIREDAGVIRLLAFDHPTAGRQFIKGTIEDDEAALEAAIRELEEEGGIVAAGNVLDLGEAQIGSSVWHFFALRVTDLPERTTGRATISATPFPSSGIPSGTISAMTGIPSSTRRSR